MKSTHSSKYKYLLYTLLIAGGTCFIACGGGSGSHSDSTSVGTSEQPATVTPDTAPAAEVPPGAINPGEDSSRYGTGVADSSKNRQK
ncbi:hypothetical protein [Chitinophaga pinensis]|uniref:Lipoprotein n=1 Tax=Chitinophaga pinensis TaxID=79329 RepID=A0A5C6LPZ1_9BACT|nr:hypothetical protein [Chitinophaga pinensis]TWV93998.1 hypothetical protein FEF09_26295 [Chitinophaga pinensis]